LFGGSNLFSSFSSWLVVIGIAAAIVGGICCMIQCGCCKCSKAVKSSDGFRRRGVDYTPVPRERDPSTTELETTGFLNTRHSEDPSFLSPSGLGRSRVTHS
jgi:hypothetical protein